MGFEGLGFKVGGGWVFEDLGGFGGLGFRAAD